MNYNSLDSISETARIKINDSLIEPLYYDDIKSIIRNRKNWRIAGHVLETMSKITIAVSSILSFYSCYSSKSFEFYAGSASTISIALNQLGTYCFKQCRENTYDLNEILNRIKIEPIPNIDDNEYD